MSEPDRSGKDRSLGDLFDNLPTASTAIPEREPRDEAPAPGTRRARRQAQQTPPAPAPTPQAPDESSRPAPGGSTASEPAPAEPASAPTEPASAPDEPAPAPQPASSTDPTSHDDEGSLEALFTPEQHREPRAKPRGRGCLIALIIVLVLVGGLAAGGVWVWNTYGDRISDIMGWGEPKDYEEGQAHGEALVTIRSGDTGRPVSSALYEAGVTKTDEVFYEWLLEEDPSVTFYPGVYKLQKKMTAEAALKALQDPANRMENTVRIPEGGTIESSLPRIVDGVGIPLADLEAAVKDPAVYGVQGPSLEGWLFPAVYTFDPGATAKDVIARMVERTRQSLEEAGVPDADAQRILTIASIIEREGRTPDFPKVSRVIQNRLDQGMKLQMDSTAQYGYGELHAGSASTSKEAQNDDNPWNTYVIDGLPAGPIANPSDAAIDAAMHPADGDWLYFVTINMNTGETQFSSTYEEHQRGIDKWHAWCRENPDSGC
ncbi:endolytic transglycosylase MltG [Microbacterium sp.]|uniref:endolytic transglycosylase MltG n=1 Tax=Microbacterium sp. TaxID=51671 RepID=UPI002811D840|nr:endolytic transglycosylase MltG [Microbacterium sp.]